MEEPYSRTNYFINYLNDCLREHKEYKEVKDKIFFFMGTLFTTAFIGTGFLISQRNAFSNAFIIYQLQYVLLHCFFFLLFLFYNYNRLLSETFLLEAVYCEKYIKENVNKGAIHFAGIKENYLYANWYGGKQLKHSANVLLVILYGAFSAIPLIFALNIIEWKDFKLTVNGTFVISFIIFIILYITFDMLYTQNYKQIVKEVKKKWSDPINYKPAFSLIEE